MVMLLMNLVQLGSKLDLDVDRVVDLVVLELEAVLD